MPGVAVPQLYKEHYIDKQDERIGLFRTLADRYPIKKVLYPGSFVDISPSMIFPEVVYVDFDEQYKDFMHDTSVNKYISSRKQYQEPAIMRLRYGDYSKPFGEKEGYFDLLISLYAGFVSQDCKRYLQQDGFLLVNNSHADAEMAFVDEDYSLIGIVNRRGDVFSLRVKDLQTYFIPRKKDAFMTKELIIKRRRGLGFTKYAYAYLFQYAD